jgi:glycyl-tRNA synthetase beta chain
MLLEVGTEELPPRSIKALSEALGKQLYRGLRTTGLATSNSEHYKVFATPRRLAVQVPEVRRRQPDQISERRGPAWQAAFDANGQPTQAAVGFARSCGVAPKQLDRLENDKGAWLVFRQKQKGVLAHKLIPTVVADALKALPIPKRMRWGASDEEFVRPVHWLVLLHGNDAIKCELLSVKAGRETTGHRFHYPKPIALRSAKIYPGPLEQRGYVLADFSARKALIRTKVEALAKRKKGIAIIGDELLEEVTGLVEWPVPILGSFDKSFLKIPPEPLIAAMRDHQRYFHVVDNSGALMPYFITVANIKSKDVAKIREGNMRVIRARFADAQFFWQSDCSTRLEHKVKDLAGVVFHVKLGSVADKVSRVRGLASAIAKELGGSTQLADRAALLAKADLMTGMVGEFPELQGTMGRYYAQHDIEDPEVATAIQEHYLPRHAGDKLPRTQTGQALAIADRLDTLIGIFSVGEGPTGDKDPFALRRTALGVLRIIIEGKLELDLQTLLASAWRNYPESLRQDDTVDSVYGFMMDRLRVYYAEVGVRPDVYEAVVTCQPARPLDFDRRVRAVMAFRKLPESESLTSANKRIRNILRQGGNADWDHVSTVLLTEPAERQLAQQVQSLEQTLTPLFDQGDYTQAMKRLAALRPQVDEFFDKVMVMVDEEAVRDNRLALLSGLSALFLRVADLSKLQD